jgi:integrase
MRRRAVLIMTYHQMASSSTQSLLMGARVAPATSTAYKKAYDKFQHFITHTAPHTTETPSDMDKALQVYITHLYDLSTTKSRSEAEKAFCAVLFYRPDVKFSLHFSSAMLKGWTQLHPSMSKPPLTWTVVVLLASTMASYGHFDAGLATLLGFDCLLRISEYCNFLISDVILPDNRVVGSTQQTSLRIRRAKTGKEQSVAIWHVDVLRLLMIHLRRHSRDDPRTTKLFAFTAPVYSMIFKNALASLSMSHLGFTPHSLRHGGASQLYRQNHSVETIRERGRWSVNSSAFRTYLQVVAAAQLDLVITTAHTDRANIILNDFYAHMSAALFPDILSDDE